METGSTIIAHNSESQIEADHCLDPGCYTRSIIYNATMRQLNALTELSQSCRQFFRFDCLSVPFEFNGVPYAWWTDRSGIRRYFWAGNKDTAHTCQCGIDDDCVVSEVKCNCDSLAGAELFDEGYIAEKEYLLVTQLNFGRTLASNSYGRHTLSALECSGRALLDRMPGSCEDLWKIGHALNGFYDFKGGKEIRSVYCDFNQMPEDQGMETLVGLVDIKSTPVYFHVQRNTSQSLNGTIPFEMEHGNIGGGMNISTGVFTAPKSGIYYFSFTVLKSRSPIEDRISLYKNSELITSTFGHNLDVYLAMSLSSTLHLQQGDNVRLHLEHGQLFENGVHFYTNFNGILLQEEI